MADEPRRSGRATKGQHTKKDDEVTEPTSKSKKDARKKRQSKQQEHEEEETEDDFPIRCICGATSDDGTHSEDNWIGCEDCEAWQHCDCIGVSRDPKKQPKKYLCELCGPQNHPEIVEAEKNGLHKSQVAERHREEYREHGEALFNKPKKGSRRSEGLKESAPPEPAQAKSKTPDVVPGQSANGPKRKSSTAAPPLDSKRRKSEQVKQESVESSTALVNAIAELSDTNRIKVAKGLAATLMPIVRSKISSGAYKPANGESPEIVAEQLAVKIEYSMFMNHCDLHTPDFGGAYKDAYLRIHPNLKRNPDLTGSLLQNSLSPDTLSKMTSEDMQSEKQRAADAATRERLEKQSIIEQPLEKPRMRRTHKGDELIEDQNTMPISESISSVAAIPRRRESQLDSPAVDSPTEMKSPTFPDGAAGSPGESGERRASQYDINEVWRHVEGGSGSRPMQQAPRRFSSNAPPSQVRNAEDADIDRLLDDGGTDSAPYSPTEYNGPSGTVWRGKLSLKNVGTTLVNAVHAAGSDLIDRGGLQKFFPTQLLITGRIPSAQAIRYIGSFYASRNTDIAVANLVPDFEDNSALREFDQIFDYCMSRDRWGVVGEELRKDNVRDIYIFPIEKGDGPLPAFLTMLQNNMFEQQAKRDHRSLCVVFIIRWNPNDEHSPSGGTPAAAGNVLSPIAQAPPPSAMSPTGVGAVEQRSGPTPPIQLPLLQNGNGGFPGNPYTQTPQPYGQYQPQLPPQSYDNATKSQMIAYYLGPYAQAPAAVELLSMAGDVDQGQLQGLRRVFDAAPETRTNLILLTEHLNRTAQAQQT